MGRILLVIIFYCWGQHLWANSCCGQSPASFTVLSLEQKVSLSTAYSLVESQGRVFDSGEFFVWNDHEREIQSLQVNLASSFAERQQVFVNTSVLRGRYSDVTESTSSQHLSDTQMGYTYEVLPEYSFSYWKPVVFLSALVNVPTGKSIYESSSLGEGAGVTGHNQWGLGLGLTLRKVYFPLTITLQAKSLRIFSKKFETLRVSSFYDNSLALLFNYATGVYGVAINLGVTSNQLTPRNISTSNQSSGTMQNTAVSVGAQKSLANSWSAGLSYADQTLIGKAKNTLLNKTYSFNLNYNYF